MSNNTVLIVGASSEIGCEIIRQISDSETTILAHYFSNKETLDALQSDVTCKIIPIKADLSTESGVDELIACVEEYCKFPNKIVFLAAPRMTMVRFKDLTWGDFKHHSDMQLCSSVKVCARFLPQMAREKNGNVVFVLSSTTLGVPPASMAHYVTAKYAMLGLMKALAAEYASKLIKINAVSPSMVETRFLSEIPEKIVQYNAEQHPFKRNASPGDVAPAVRFLLSEDAGFMTGVNVPITGGTQA